MFKKLILILLFSSYMLLLSIVFANENLYSEDNLIYVIEVFDAVNNERNFVKSCDCVEITSIEETTSIKFPSPEYKVLKVKTKWTNKELNSSFDSIHYMAHKVGTDNSTWFVHHLKFGMKEIKVP